ncbi:blast:Neuromedin-U receptor 2 [Mytilus galloprovincialis]|uniref:Blast:Neuromedin-U receptor 2 n=2 Tax=Mytilus TaxID=6548 RepID=A0A8B6CIW1_MYTGA|nr:blast:Neuromedin-U receptor 2 [Mytilus galloprovincialis]
MVESVTDVMENSTCHTWIPAELQDRNVTLELLNELHVKRNIGGIIMLLCFSVVGLIGNTHVLYVYSRQYKQSNYRIYVLFLAMLDVINCTVVAPLVVVYLFHPLMYPSNIFCKVFRTILYYMAIASTLSLVSIAIERFRKIRFPFKEKLSESAVIKLCIGSLVVAAILSWPAPILWGLSTVETGVPGFEGKRCFTDDSFRDSKINLQAIYNACLILFYFLVSGTLIVIYIYIGKNIRKQYKFRGEQIACQTRLNGRKDSVNTNGNSARNATYTLCAVTFAYVGSALPHHLLALLIFLIPNFDCSMSLFGSRWYYTFVWSYFFNSVINPFIYGIRDRKFRFAVKNIYRVCGK